MRTAVFTLEGKGGVGKSTTSALAVHALEEDGKRAVAVVDCDTTNSTMASMYRNVTMVDPTAAEAAGILMSLFSGPEDAMVVDTGARAEASFIRILDRVVPRAKELKVNLVVLRPLTSSSFAQNNAAYFVERMAPKGVKVVLVRVLAQGRTDVHFADWHQSAGRAAALKAGAVEMDLTDVGVRWGDEVPAFGLSFQDVAMGDFSKIDPALRPLAQTTFNPGIQCHMGMWVEENAIRLLEAFRKLGIKL